MKLLHITITTQDIEKSAEFYREIAGLKVERANNGAPFKIVFLANSQGETAVELVENKSAPKYENAPSIGFHVGDVKAYREQLIEKGFAPTPIVSPVPNVEFFYVEDPNGIKVQFS